MVENVVIDIINWSHEWLAVYNGLLIRLCKEQTSTLHVIYVLIWREQTNHYFYRSKIYLLMKLRNQIIVCYSTNKVVCCCQCVWGDQGLKPLISYSIQGWRILPCLSWQVLLRLPGPKKLPDLWVLAGQQGVKIWLNALRALVVKNPVA